MLGLVWFVLLHIPARVPQGSGQRFHQHPRSPRECGIAAHQQVDSSDPENYTQEGVVSHN